MKQHQIDEICRRYLSGESSTSIAKDLGIAPSTVIYHLKKHSVLTRKRGSPKGQTKNYPLKLPQSSIQEICRRYKNGESANSIAGDFNTTAATVIRYLNNSGINTDTSRMYASSPLSSKDTEEICRRYAAGETSTQIGEHLGISAVTVLKHLRKAGYAIRKKGIHSEAHQYREEICRRYLNGEYISYIAQRFESDTFTVRGILEERGIELRGQTMWNKLPAPDICRRYAAGESLTVLAREYGVARNTLKTCLKNAGMPLRPTRPTGGEIN